MERTKFSLISRNEIKFEYKKMKFVLEEKKQGVYGMGSAVLLHQLDGVTKTFVKTIGWTKTDNHDGEKNKECLLNGIVRFDDCKIPALNYVKSLID